ncbi:hypothetical protein BDZ89DRAFT_1159324 [Hymenopellis radicata]|nr:hypothetical protein BDZ89DRAFT_1159324 [Hymenopellis radicata]
MESNCSSSGTLPGRNVLLERHDQATIPFHHLFASNLPPTDRELYDIQTTILPVLDQDILAVDSDAAVTTGPLALESLEQERDALKTIKQNYENIISTRRRIPPEIWSEIFLYAHSLDSDKKVYRASRTIWKLSQVCQTWRNLAFSLHSCWSSIVLEYFSSELQVSSERNVEILAFVLERSHQHLLDITFGYLGSGDLPFPRRMREMVFAESHRWRTARLADYHEVRRDLLYAPLRGRLPQLERLDLHTVPFEGAVISAFMDCPRLVKVTLFGPDPRVVELPVKQITCLHLRANFGDSNFRAYADLIGQCSLLEILFVDSVSEPVQDPLLQSPTHPCLRDLTTTCPYLLDSLTVPQLEVAALDQRVSCCTPDTLYSFCCLIQRSNCASNLTELRLIGVPLTLHRSEPHHLLLSILCQTIKLGALQLEASMLRFQEDDPFHGGGTPDDWSVTQIMDIMRALEVVPGHTVTFLPRLVSLDIMVTDHTDMDCIPYLEPHDDFLAMLKARRAGNEVGLVSKLEKFHFALRTALLEGRNLNHPEMYELRKHEALFHGHDASVLRGLCEDGMDLIIRFDGIRGFDQ